MKKNNPIQSLWVGPELSNMEIMCINSYLAHGHDFYLYTYCDIPNVPSGAIIKDANSIIPEKDIYLDNYNSYAHFADLFRFTMLYKAGGWWVDTDSVCLKPFDFRDDFVFSSELTNDCKRHYRINNGYMKSKSGAKFLKECLDFLSARGHEYIHWGELGITLLSRMVFRNNLERYIKPPEYFCPVSYYHVDQLINDTTYSLPENSYALHWWNELWRRQGIDKNAKFSESCLYEIMKAKYLNL